MHFVLCHSHHGRLNRVIYWCFSLHGTTVLQKSSAANLRLVHDNWSAVPSMSTPVTVIMGLSRVGDWCSGYARGSQLSGRGKADLRLNDIWTDIPVQVDSSYSQRGCSVLRWHCALQRHGCRVTHHWPWRDVLTTGAGAPNTVCDGAA